MPPFLRRYIGKFARFTEWIGLFFQEWLSDISNQTNGQQDEREYRPYMHLVFLSKQFHDFVK